jgi:Transposase DNA-binding/Transposase Tn5 dimerisation domain
MQTYSRGFTDLDDLRLVKRGNKILTDLFSKSIHSIRQICNTESDAKGFYRFLLNDRVSEDDIMSNISQNCVGACRNKFVVCIQDTTEINLSHHRNRIKKDNSVGVLNERKTQSLGFLMHPSLVLDALDGTPYGYADIKLWNRPLEFTTKEERKYQSLPIEQKESYKWIEVSNNTKSVLEDHVKGMVIIQDREGDIYEQFALVPDATTDLLVRARANRTLKDGVKLFNCIDGMASVGDYEILIDSTSNVKRTKRKARLEIRYKPVIIQQSKSASKKTVQEVLLYFIEANEVGYEGEDKICWRLLTTIPVDNLAIAKMCLEWYSWRWTIEEVFKIVKKEGYNIEASELESASSIRKMTLMIMEVVIKLFLMRLAYAEPELDINADACFSEEEQEFLEEQIKVLEGKTDKQKNPFKVNQLNRYVWAIARLGGWKGYEGKKHPGITTLWLGLKYFKARMEGWNIFRNVSTR